MTSVLTNPGRSAPTGTPQDLLGALGDGSVVTLANFDILNSAYVGYSRNISSSSGNTVEIPPLGSAVIDVSRQTWIVCAPGKTADIRIMPGAVQWTPSPAQTAAQINALGLAKDTSVQATTSAVGGTTTAVQGISGQFVASSLYSTGAVNLPGGATPQFVNISPLVPVSLTGTGLNGASVDFFSSYEISLVNACNGSTASGVYTVQLQWFNDVADTSPVEQVTWQVPANVAGLVVVGKGPMRGNFMAVQIASNDQAGLSPQSTVTVKITGSLRDTPLGDDWRAGSVGIGGNASSAKPWTNMILYSTNLSAPVGTLIRDSLLYSGRVKVFLENNSANGILIAQFMAQLAPNPMIWRGSVPQSQGGASPVLVELLWPRAPVTMTVSNTGAAAGNLDVSVVADR